VSAGHRGADGLHQGVGRDQVTAAHPAPHRVRCRRQERLRTRQGPERARLARPGRPHVQVHAGRGIPRD